MLLLFCGLSSYAQDIKIDSTNYCNFYNDTAHYKDSDIKSFHLTETMIIDIVHDEMIKLGYKWISTFSIIKIDSNNYITSICYSDKSNCGFVLENMTELLPSQQNRNIVSLNKRINGYDYGEKIISINGGYDFVKIKEIPKNLHILKMADYWFQTSSNEEKNKKLVSKEFVLELLREDVRHFLKGLKP